MLEICKYIQFKLNHRDIPMPPCIIFTLKTESNKVFRFFKEVSFKKFQETRIRNKNNLKFIRYVKLLLL